MEITSVGVAGFRSLTAIRLSPLARTTILAGRNSSGKSNILRALRLATDPSEFGSSLLEDDFSPGSSEIQITLDINTSAHESTTLDQPIRAAEAGVSKPLTDFVKTFYPNIHYFVRFRKDDLGKHTVYLGYKKTTNLYPLFAKGASTAVNNQILKAFEELLRQHYRMITTRDSFGSIKASERDEISAVLMGQFVSIDPAQRARYNEIRDSLLFITEGIGGEIQPAQLPPGGESNESPPRCQTRSEVERSYYVPLSYMGDGAQRVALTLYYLVNSQHATIGIEEPELSLHPGAQKRFRATLDRLCSKYQKRLLLTTHSPTFLVGWEAAILFKIDISKGRTVVDEAVEREQALQVARMLGVGPGDALAADGIIWVEGPSDVEIYGAFLRTLGSDPEANNILLMWGGGDAMRHVHANELMCLNPNFAVVMDSDRTSAHKEVTPWKKRLAEECGEKGVLAFITERREIENYFSPRALREYYRKPNLPPVGEYEQLTAQISTHAPGQKYLKMRDAGAIARAMTAREVDNLADVTRMLREIRRLISRWKSWA